MPFVTRLTLTSGDHDRLDDVVGDLKERASRKGVELKGPHPKPPDEYRVPQSKCLGPGEDRFESWHYTVYERTMEIVGSEAFTRSIASEAFPPGVHVAATVEQRSPVGGN